MTQFKSQLALYPAMTPIDLLKLCYQAEFGGGHLLADLASARAYLHREMEQTPPDDAQPLFEELGGGHARINLAAAKSHGVDEDLIFDLFAASARPCGSAENFRARLDAAKKLADEKIFSFTGWDLADCIAHYDFKKLAPIGHSEVYRAAYHPAYRVIDSRYIKLISLLEALRKLLNDSENPVVLAIAGSKSDRKAILTLLAPIFGGVILPLDENPLSRKDMGDTLTRLHNPAVLCPLFERCKAQPLHATALRIVEGEDALHPAYGDYADLRLLIGSPEEANSDESPDFIV